MRQLPIVFVLAAALLAGCGVDTAATAVTAAALKKQEIEQGKQTKDLAERRIGQAVDQMQQRTQQQAADSEGK